MYFHQVFPHCFLKTERKFTDPNYCAFEDRHWPGRRQWKTSSTDCSCRKEQGYFSAAIAFWRVLRQCRHPCRGMPVGAAAAAVGPGREDGRRRLVLVSPR